MLARRPATKKPATLVEALKERIAATGPLTVADYMQACLNDPEHGYYTTRVPFGSAGDFTTAPEISQIFGELIGLWCAVVWQQMGAPAPVRLVELGPGRGTLMADALRAAASVPGFLQALDVHLVETSPVLRKMQARLLEPSGVTPNWHETPAGLPEGAAIIVANEFLDALPVHQFVSSGGKWFERQVGMSAKGKLQFLRSSEPLETPDILPRAMRNPARDGDIAEVRPGADELVRTIAARATGSPIAALFIDYGHGTSAPGDTLQAVRAHDYADPLARPGQADLTSHVDFGRLAETARAAGLRVHGPLTQGQFLLALGLSERCERLMEHAAEGDRGLIASGALRLADRAQMGELFKAMALVSPELEPPPFTANSGPEPGK